MEKHFNLDLGNLPVVCASEFVKGKLNSLRTTSVVYSPIDTLADFVVFRNVNQ